MNANLPSYVVMSSLGSSSGTHHLYSRLWNSGFLPTEHSGVRFRNGRDPIHFLSNPAGIGRPLRRDLLDDLGQLNAQQYAVIGDPEIEARIAQHEMACNQASQNSLTYPTNPIVS